MLRVTSRRPTSVTTSPLLRQSAKDFPCRPRKPSTLATHPLTAWQGPLGLPDFTRIDDGDFSPVFDAALEAHEAEIEAISGNVETPTIENTLAALELGGEALDHVSSIFWCPAPAPIPTRRSRRWSVISRQKCRGISRRSR